MRGSGADIWGAADAFQYAFQPWRGDCGFIARIAHIEDTDSFARAGIMFRATLDPASPHVFVAFRAGGRTALQARTMAGENTWADGSWVWAPYWVKLVRYHNRFYAYESPNGSTWTLLDSIELNMPEDFFVGFAVTSGQSGALCAATFDNAQLASIPLAPSGLVALRTFDSIELSWRDNATNELGYNVELSVWDDFFSRKPIPANTTNYHEEYLYGQAIPRLGNRHQQFIFLSTGYGAVSQFRANPGGATAQIATGEWRYPGLWLRLRRTGNLFSGYLGSGPSDGALILSCEIQMTGPVYVGMAVSSHRNDFLQICSFEKVLIAPAGGSLRLSRAANGVNTLYANGEIDRNYQLQASTNLRQWIPLAIHRNTTGTFAFTDIDAANFRGEDLPAAIPNVAPPICGLLASPIP